MKNFAELFSRCVGHDRSPYGYQCRLACGPQANPEVAETLEAGTECQSLLIDIPTGLGKTAAVVLAWLWNFAQIGTTAGERNDTP